MPILEEKRKTADRLLEQGLTQKFKEALLSNLALLLQLDKKTTWTGNAVCVFNTVWSTCLTIRLSSVKLIELKQS